MRVTIVLVVLGILSALLSFTSMASHEDDVAYAAMLGKRVPVGPSAGVIAWGVAAAVFFAAALLNVTLCNIRDAVRESGRKLPAYPASGKRAGRPADQAGRTEGP